MLKAEVFLYNILMEYSQNAQCDWFWQLRSKLSITYYTYYFPYRLNPSVVAGQENDVDKEGEGGEERADAITNDDSRSSDHDSRSSGSDTDDEEVSNRCSRTGPLFWQFWGLPFSALRYQRELSEEQYSLEVAAEVAYCFELNSLWHRSAEKGNRRIARIKDQWGISFYVFHSHHCNPVSSRN